MHRVDCTAHTNLRENVYFVLNLCKVTANYFHCTIKNKIVAVQHSIKCIASLSTSVTDI